MRILCVCDQGVSRSPTLAALLQYRGHETLAIGAERSSDETRRLLAEWADLVILTDVNQLGYFPTLQTPRDGKRLEVWPIADAYPRPFNQELRQIVLRFAGEKGL